MLNLLHWRFFKKDFLMRFCKIILSLAVLVIFSGCNSQFFSAIRPSEINDGSSGLIAVDTPEGQIGWSPWIVVHSDGSAVEGYRKALTELKSKGMVRGVRVGLSGYRDTMVQMINSLGIEMIGIVPNESLFDPSPETMIGRYISAYPEIKVFQIGNEVTTINQLHGLSMMTIEEYMDVFKKIYAHVQSRLSSVMLMTQSTFGSGDYGSNELKRMVELGLKPNIISPQRVIVGVNIYSDNALSEYISTRNRYLGNPDHGGYRVWVMETGSSNPSEQINHVRLFYPRLTNALGAERIYWYVLWDGDSMGEDYGLIRNPYNPNWMTYSPLFKALARIQ